MAEKIFDCIKYTIGELVSTVHGHITSATDTTGALAKQKIYEKLISSDVVQSERIRHALQIGIGYFLDRINPSDSAPHKYIEREKFPAAGSESTPSHNLPDFDIEAYGLDIFKSLMNIYGIDPPILRSRVCEGELQDVENSANSGALIYLTPDSSFLIKAIRDYDARFLQQDFLSEYHNYVKNNSATFLAKLFGCFGYIPYLSEQNNITVDSFTLRFVIFSNFIPTDIEIHEKYDLKGSSYGRDATGIEKQETSVTFKDNDFREIHPQGFTLPKRVYHHLKEVLTRDVKFLANLNIIDYSLLITVHNMDNQEKPTHAGTVESLIGTTRDTFLMAMTKQIDQNDKDKSEKPKSVLKFKKPIETLGLGYKELSTIDTENSKAFGGIPALNEKGERLLLFFGIIDILQTFDFCKMMQRQYEAVVDENAVDDRSIIETGLYADRFKKFLFERVFHPAEDELSTHPISMNVFTTDS